MPAKKLILLGLLAMVLFSWALWTIWEKESRYIDIEPVPVKNVVRIQKCNPADKKKEVVCVFHIRKSEETKTSKLEITVDSVRGLRRAEGVPADRPILVQYICGNAKNCRRISNFSRDQKINVEVLKIMVHNYDEIEALP